MTHDLKFYARQIVLEDFQAAGIPVSVEFQHGLYDFMRWQCLGNPGICLHDTYAELGGFKPNRARHVEPGRIYMGDSVYVIERAYPYEACDFPARLIKDIQAKLVGRDKRYLCPTK